MSDPQPKSSGSSFWPLLLITTLAVAGSRRASPAPAAARVAAPAGDRAAAAEPRPQASGVSGAERGRAADKPSDIPAQGWWDIAKRVYSEINDDRVMAVAAGVTFYGLLALFPAITALVSLYGLFADPATIGKQLGALSGILPDGALQIIGDQVTRITSKPAGSLSLAFVFSLAVSLWSANAGMKAFFDALNVVYNEKETRSFIKLNAISLLFTLGAVLILVVALAAVVVVPAVLNVIGLSGDLGTELIALARWPVLLVLIAVALAVMYRYGPSRARAKWRWISWGSAFAAVGWMLASGLFSIYVSKFGSYNATYGSLGAVIGFMTWIWVSTIVILIGGEISAEIEHQTDRDTTEGPDKPKGTRGAVMADDTSASR